MPIKYTTREIRNRNKNTADKIGAIKNSFIILIFPPSKKEHLKFVPIFPPPRGREKPIKKVFINRKDNAQNRQNYRKASKTQTA
jgi:hypothetical protein